MTLGGNFNHDTWRGFTMTFGAASTGHLEIRDKSIILSNQICRPHRPDSGRLNDIFNFSRPKKNWDYGIIRAVVTNGKQKILETIAVLVAAIPLLAQCSDDMTYLGPENIKQIGEFCYTGVVTASWILEEPNGRRQYIYISPRFGVCTGDVIAVKGGIIQRENGSVQKSAYHVKHLGKSPVPPPMKAPLAELLHQDSLCRRVITEGTLVLLRKDEIDSSASQLIVKDGTTVLNAAVNGITTHTIDLTSLLGARLRLTGTLIPSTGARMNALKYLAIENNGIEVVKPPPVDIFDATRCPR